MRDGGVDWTISEMVKNRPSRRKTELSTVKGRFSASGEIRISNSSPISSVQNMKSDAYMNVGFYSECSLAQYDSWLAALDSCSQPEDPENTLLLALQNIRNKIIGNKEVKKLMVSRGLISKLIKIIEIKDQPNYCQKECAVMIGSILADQSIQVSPEQSQILASQLLATSATTKEEKNYSCVALQEASLRALRGTIKNCKSIRSLPFLDGNLNIFLENIRTYINSDNIHCQNITQYSASILAISCDNSEKQELLYSSNILDILGLFLESSIQKILEVGLDLAAAITRENSRISQKFAYFTLPCGVDVLRFLAEISENHPKPDIRLLACVAVTNLYRSCAISNGTDLITKRVLPALTQLFDESGQISVRAPLVMAFLVSNDEKIQSAAISCNAVAKLISMLESYEKNQKMKSEYCVMVLENSDLNNSTQSDQECESALIALAAISSSLDECRKLIIDSNALKVAVKLLSSEKRNLRSASCQCIRSLSRSVKNLRTHLLDAGIVEPIIKLLGHEEDLVVKVAACATICNMVLDFSSVKSSMIEKNAVDLVVNMIKSTYSGLRLNAVWAMKNLLYLADKNIKQEVMSRLTFNLLFTLTYDPDIDVQTQALNMLRNLACGEESDIMQVIQGIGIKRLMEMIKEKLSSERKDILLQTLYIVVNLATGGILPKGAIMDDTALLRKIGGIIKEYADDDVKLAATWCVINLTWPDDEGASERVEILRSHGIEDSLKAIQPKSVSNIDLNDRVVIALEHFTGNS